MPYADREELAELMKFLDASIHADGKEFFLENYNDGNCEYLVLKLETRHAVYRKEYPLEKNGSNYRIDRKRNERCIIYERKEVKNDG